MHAREGYSSCFACVRVCVCVERTIECAVCRRLFRREADKARHECSSERAKPVDEQRGSVKCDACGRWFRSRGGLVSRASPSEKLACETSVVHQWCQNVLVRLTGGWDYLHYLHYFFFLLHTVGNFTGSSDPFWSRKMITSFRLTQMWVWLWVWLVAPPPFENPAMSRNQSVASRNQCVV